MKAADRITTMENYYFADKLAEVRQLIKNGKDIINLGIGNPDMSAPSIAIEELYHAAQAKDASSYQPYRGLPELRMAFIAWYKRIYDVDLKDEEVLPLMGSKEAIMHIHLAFCNPENAILIPNPGYPTYAASAKLLGLKCIEYNLMVENDWLPDMEELESIDVSKCKVMWINYPHMPTGAVADTDSLERLVTFAERHNIMLVNDNPYSLILNDNPISIHAHKEKYNDILELNSLSKSYNMQGWRVGVVSGSVENISHILKVKSNFDSGMYKPIQQAAIRALQLDETWIKGINDEYQKRAKIAFQICDALNCSYDTAQSGMFVWAKVNNPKKNGATLSDELLEVYGIFAPPGKIFGSNGERYIRLSLCVPQSRLKQGLQRIKNGKV